MPYQIIRRLVMSEHETKEEALKQLHENFQIESSKKRLRFGDFKKEELLLTDDSIIKIIEIKQK
jgi:hypothetical protein